MSGENSVARGGRAAVPSAQDAEFGIPPEVANRYEVRGIDGPGGEQRLGLFRPGQRDAPVIEIADSGTANRIVARSEDLETIRTLVQIAQHNGWNRVDVDGSAEFRKAVWTEATRAGLDVDGYEPTIVERKQATRARAEARSGDSRGEIPIDRARDTAPEPCVPPVGPTTLARSEAPVAGSEPERRELSDDDSRLLLRISALTEDRHRLVETLDMDMPRLAREVQAERVGENREALVTALDRALESPPLARSFDRAGYPVEDLRGMADADEWDGGIADSIYLVRSGLHRDTMKQVRSEDRSAGEVTPDLRERIEASRDVDSKPAAGAGAGSPVEVPDRSASDRPGGDDLAELFLRGSPERVAADPRLAGAVQAQTAMEHHIGEVFAGDATRLASANLESRQMISDALRRNLDVSVREPTVVRQIEPVQIRADLER